MMYENDYTMTIEEANRRVGIIKDLCSKYRKELTIYGAILSDEIGLMSIDDYIKVFNGLSHDAFIGNYLTILTNTEAIEHTEKLLHGTLDFDGFLKVIDEPFGCYERLKELIDIY